MKMADRKVLMLGLDALVPNLIERFVEEGLMPNFKRLMEEGCFTRLLSSIPAQTPANWHTVATGAAPGTHSVVVWGAHRPTDPIPETHRAEAFSSGLCLAEYIWEAAARHGIRSVVMNYPGYPPTTDMAVHIDRLYQPVRSYYDISPPTVYHNLDVGAGDRVEFEKEGAEAEILVRTSSEGEGPKYLIRLIRGGDGYEGVSIVDPSDPSKPIAELRVGEWSDWIRARFRTEEMGEVEGAFRFKLVELSPDGKRFRLYRSEAYPTDGRFASDEALGKKLIERLGPYVHAMMTAQLHVAFNLLDFETVDQALADEARWWAEAARMAMEETGARLLYLHWHLPDLVGHKFVPWIDPTGTEYSPEKAEEGWRQLRNYYKAMDRFVGEFLKRFDLSENVVAIVSEHGMPANKKAVSLINLFKERGWLKLSPDGKRVIWRESKLFFDQNHLWINLKGREPTGIVPPEEYEELRREVQKAMRDLKDPETGEHVFSFVLTREEAPIVGLWGEHIGDLVFCYAGGYRWTGAEVLSMGEERVVFPCGGGNHGPMIPSYETEVASVYGTLIIAGPGVKKGVKEDPSEKGRRRTVDVAPTLAFLLGIDPPAQNDGRVLHEFLEGFKSDRPERKLIPMARKLLPLFRPKKPKLKGDVTDEEA